MVRTASTMLALGTKLPEFSLPDVTSGRPVTPATFSEKTALLVMFICPHCPYVKHVEAALARLAVDYADASLGIVAINANDIAAYPQDGPEGMRAQVAAAGFSFPYCLDETQEVAQAFTAACTPDIFLFDAQRHLAYRGQLDGSRPGGAQPPDGADVRAAIDAVLRADAPPAVQRPSLGCNIKWAPGNEPAWFTNLPAS